MIKVELLDHMGSDLTVVNAARVSFDKASEWEVYEVERESILLNRNVVELKDRLSTRDTKLIKYLADHNHWSPFAHPQASFRIQAPVFVARQLQKHTVGLAWNEVSRRYVDTPPSFYTPQVWRKRAENVKQGSSVDESVRLDWQDGAYGSLQADVMGLYEDALTTYNLLLKAGVCPEQARMVLPQSMMTEWIWTGSLYAFARVCNLRLDSHTQKETQRVAEQIAAYMATLFPVSWDALVPAVVQSDQ